MTVTPPTERATTPSGTESLEAESFEAESFEVEPFEISVPQAELDDLRERLARARWPDELDGVGWDHGVPAGYVRELAAYWRDGFDWRAQERRLNAYPQFAADVAGQRVHFLHVRSPEPDALPLLLVHGWGTTFAEFLDVIGPLTEPRAHGGDPRDAFHVVIPSPPGFAFSGPTTEPGQADSDRYAELFAALMAGLGYERYGAQGGDLGSLVGPQLGRVAPGNVVGVHVNGLLTLGGWDLDPDELDAGDRRRFEGLQNFDEVGGYAAVQSTRPQSLAMGLHDSPVGLLTWLADIYHLFSNPAAELPDDAVGRDALLTNVSLYWLTGTTASSMRIYKEAQSWAAELPSSGVPTGCALFPGDSTIRVLAERQNHVTHWSEFDRGGHFAAMEAPDLLVDDVRTFFRSVR
ncbi:epoxide hydrolase [Prauserella halophila]|uniref:Epoxide hydrolase n=1 Tax=Prauserella halophila TaxID=185641 RepID=A0ABN1WM57_9PSEU